MKPALGAVLTWFLCSLFYTFQFFLRSTPNALANEIMNTFHIHAGLFGLLSSLYYLPYACLQIPLGFFLDRWGPKKILRMGSITCTLGCLIFAVSPPSVSLLFLGRFFIGMGASVALIGGIRLNSLWVPSSMFAFATGLLGAFGKLGGSASNAFLPLAINSGIHWHELTLCLFFMGVLISLCIILFIKNGPKDDFSPTYHSFENIKTLLKNPLLWIMGIYGYGLYLTLTVFSDSYSINFIASHLNITQQKAGYMSSLVGIGSALGSAGITYLSDKIRNRVFFVKFCALGTFFTSIIIFFFPVFSITLFQILLFVFGFFSGGQILAFIVTVECLPSTHVGLASGIINTCLMLSGMIHNPLIGLCMRYSQSLSGLPHYQVSDYQWGLVTLSLGFFASVIASFFLKKHLKNNKIK